MTQLLIPEVTCENNATIVFEKQNKKLHTVYGGKNRKETGVLTLKKNPTEILSINLLLTLRLWFTFCQGRSLYRIVYVTQRIYGFRPT